ncbi:tetratricopeptide repeat protein [Streptomyces sp. NPDC058867]|uniref:tetratricopeptide repeat protein n=1 Tax=unclassified Streptomyces TaxID=2593676 RepID=UPI0036843D49
MGEHAERFWAELKTLRGNAPGPTLGKLVKLAGDPSPVADATVSDWLTGKTVPSKDSHVQFFLVMVSYLQKQAEASGAGYTSRSLAWWRNLLTRARDERAEARGGRPRNKAGSVPAPSPMMLPPAPPYFTGRERPLTEVLEWLDPDREHAAATVVVSAVAGMGGVGKTALALHAAHQARQRRWFPGGMLFADLRGYSPRLARDSRAVVDLFLHALGVNAKDLPDTADERLQAWQMLCDSLARQGRPLLTVLDNVRDTEQISDVLPVHPHRALITSRGKLSSLQTAHRIDLDPLSPADAVALLDRALRAGGAHDERVTTQADDAHRLATLCGCLPLAIRIIAALLRDQPWRSLADQADDLADSRSRLSAIAYPSTDSEQRPLAVRASIDLSYEHLGDAQRKAFRLLSAAPGADISTSAAKILLDNANARRLLSDLDRAHLLQNRPGPEERWAMHDLIRLFADEHSLQHSEPDHRPAAVTRLLDHYLATAQAATAHLDTQSSSPGPERFANPELALTWLEAERSVLVACATEAITHHHPASFTLAFALAPFFDQRGYGDDWTSLSNTAVSQLRSTGDLANEGAALSNLASACRSQRRFDEALQNETAALGIFRKVGLRAPEAASLLSIGLIHTDLRNFNQALENLTAAHEAYRKEGNRYGEAMALDNLGLLLRSTGRPNEAVDYHASAVTLFQEHGDLRREGLAQDNLGIALTMTRRFDEAITAHTRFLAICEETNDLRGLGNALNSLGFDLALAGKPGEAVGRLTEAVKIYQETNDRHAEGRALNNLGGALAKLRRLREASHHFAEASAIYHETGDRHREREAALNSAKAHNELVLRQAEHDEPPAMRRPR